MTSRRAAHGSASVSHRELLLFRKLASSRTPSRSACVRIQSLVSERVQ